MQIQTNIDNYTIQLVAIELRIKAKPNKIHFRKEKKKQNQQTHPVKHRDQRTETHASDQTTAVVAG